LIRIAPAFAAADTTFASVEAGYAKDVPGHRFAVVGDANLQTKLDLLRVTIRMVWLMLRVRPDVVISTGAAPGFIALVIGRVFGTRTVWIDSIANAETMSMSGWRVRRYADLWLTQWEHLATPDGPTYGGSVL
jgi:UDP-N-acetylglucosamine:LPS N-acetylglucosamine transferase